MNHKILQAHVLYEEDGSIKQVTVQADINESGDIRVLRSVNTQMSGYHWIKPNDKLTYKMIVDVVHSGFEIYDYKGFL